MKGSLGQKLKIIFGYSIYGIGFGGMVSIALVLTKKIPDKFEYIWPVVLPIALVYVFYKLVRCFNSIEIDDSKVVIKSIFGKEKEYLRGDVEFAFSEGGFNIYQQPFAPILYLHVVEQGDNKAYRHALAIYDEYQIEDIKAEIKKDKNIE